MGRNERMQLIRAIEDERNSRMLVYLAGDRRGMETKIAADIFPFILNHLSRMDRQETIDLYLYSTGGVTMAGYALVNLIREFCNTLNVIIPFKALSCATLIALGADSLIMTEMGQLSPIDPSVSSPLGPRAPAPGPPGASMVVPVNVEDVVSYLDLARKELGIADEESLTAIFDHLAEAVHPLTLGSVNRVREQIAFLATTLLSYHLENQEQIVNIVNIITTGRFSHDYLIGRKEAKETLGLNIIEVPTDLAEKIFKLYREYDEVLELSVPYHPETVLTTTDVAVGTFNRAIIESIDLTHVFRTIKEVTRVEVGPPQIPVPTVGYQERIISEKWVEDNTI